MNAHKRGFTLLEVLVALAVLAIAMLAVMRTVASSADTAAYLRDKTLAAWVADNVLTELRLKQRYPALGKSKGEQQLANRRWYWQLEVSETADKQLRKLEIRVAANENVNPSLVFFTSFLSDSP